MMRIENREKNLIPHNYTETLHNHVNTFGSGSSIIVRVNSSTMRVELEGQYYHDTYSCLDSWIPVVPGGTYTLVITRNIIQFDGNAIRETVMFTCKKGRSPISEISTPQSTTSGIYTLTFTVPIGCYWIYIRWNRSSVIHTATVEYSNMQLMYGETVIDYKLARSDFLDLPVSAFGYAGVYDEITNDGTKVKRWEQEIILPSTHTIDLYPWYTHLMLQYPVSYTHLTLPTN